MNNQSAWGDEATRYFYELGIERVLKAVERDGLECTGRCMALNSMENRVYEVEIAVDDPKKLRTPSERYRIAKFYRPGRWTMEQILDEHRFLLDLQENEIPAVAPLPFADGSTLKKVDDCDIWYALFPKIGGRAPEEMGEEQLQRLGRLLARVHNVGAVRPAPHRLRLDPATYGRNNLNYLLQHGMIPKDCITRYQTIVEKLCATCEPWFATTAYQRIHGDCHIGNILWGRDGFFLVDFDDMLMGPCVQDLWLLLPGDSEEARQKLEILVEAYSGMRQFDRNSLRLIEALRALRFVHFSAWIARRWQDPSFPRAFPQFGESKYWPEQIQDLEEQLMLIGA